MSFIDIKSVTPEGTSFKRGDYDLDKCQVTVVNKEQGSSTAIKRGYALAPINTVTPNVYKVTAGKSAKSVVISGLPFAYIPANVGADPATEDISATNEDVAINVITKGPVIVKLASTGQPGDQVMTAANGEFAKYDGSGPENIKGVFLGLPGTQGGNIIKAGWSAQLGVIDFNGGA